MLEFQIRDESGVIHSGTDSEMDSAWDVLTAGSEEQYIKNMQEQDEEFLIEENIEGLREIYAKWITGWEGDLELVQQLKIHR